MQFELEIIAQSYLKGLRDCLKPRMLALMCVPFVVAAVVVWFSWSAFGGLLDSIAQSYALVDENSSSIWTSILGALITVLNSALNFLCFFVVVVLVQLVLSIFYAPYLMAYLHKHYYPNVHMDDGLGFWESFVALLKVLVIFFCLLLLCIPLYFIPIINGIVIFALLFFLFKSTMTLDVIGSLFSREGSLQLHKRYRIELFVLLLGLYAVSLIPIVNFFMVIFQILAFGHYAFMKKVVMEQNLKSGV
ncbi:MAG: EI24 domain-containing protein [Helicobacter sp.]|nr:EI24 domain-containing protein [Helicobacter sp.]